MITAWILYAIVVGTLLSAGGLAVERLLRTHSLPSRWIWVGAIVLSVGWPSGHWAWDQRPPESMAVAPLEPAPIAPAEMTEATFILDPGAVQVSGESLLRALDEPVLAAWALSSLLLVFFFLALVLRTHLLRRGWGRGKLGGQSVLFSDEWGPAVVGFLQPQVVLPRWCKDVDDWALRFILDHELEHVRAGDLRLLLVAWTLPVLFPWHLPLWWQMSRLRTAVEGDCDLRVLRRNPGQMKSYVDLLLEVGEQSPRRRALAAMLSEPYETLKRRIKIMTMPFPKNPWTKGLLLAGIGALLIGMACWAPGPTDAAKDDLETEVETDAFPQAGETQRSAAPVFTPYTVRPDVKNRDEVAEALERGYPAALKDAGIGGRIHVWFFIDEEGTVRNVQVSRSSGYQSLDNAAIQVANIIEFTPALNRDRRVPVWVSLPIAFGPVPAEQGVAAEPGVTDGTARRAAAEPVYSAPEDSDAVGQIGGTATVAATGQPLQYAQILVAGTGYGTLSNQEGRFLIDRVPAGSYEVVSIHVGYSREHQPVSVTTGDRVDLEFDLQTQAIPLTEFKIPGRTSAPTENDQEEAESPLSVKDLRVLRTEVRDAVHVAGTAVNLETDEPVGAVDVGVAHLDMGVVTGLVSEEGTGAPISGARVSLPGVKIGAVANIHGKFLLFNVPPGTHTMLIEKDGYPTGEMEVVVEAGETCEVDPVLRE